MHCVCADAMSNTDRHHRPVHRGSIRGSRRYNGASSIPALNFMNVRTLDEILDSVTRVLPSTPEDLKRNIRAALATAFDRLDLVTREELEVQEAVLQRTRARLKELEERLTALEQLAERR